MTTPAPQDTQQKDFQLNRVYWLIKESADAAHITIPQDQISKLALNVYKKLNSEGYVICWHTIFEDAEKTLTTGHSPGCAHPHGSTCHPACPTCHGIDQ
jgi:hypothetical protein